jgi:hypothetical protein
VAANQQHYINLVNSRQFIYARWKSLSYHALDFFLLPRMGMNFEKNLKHVTNAISANKRAARVSKHFKNIFIHVLRSSINNSYASKHGEIYGNIRGANRFTRMVKNLNPNLKVIKKFNFFQIFIFFQHVYMHASLCVKCANCIKLSNHRCTYTCSIFYGPNGRGRKKSRIFFLAF